ncbi:hypothetical protein tpqmel_0913 [Candidatus Gastranaerophilus sp. (ex Termes propinquus)]|nr:hypothetical protein tpqmel_0913 [Candidatus Gastranaerophilus sp. (ex Termes propinquus)]
MYIFELIFRLREKFAFDFKKWRIEKKNAEQTPEEAPDEAFSCQHIFVPVDSTGQVLACSKCGYVVRAEDLKKIKENPFEE